MKIAILYSGQFRAWYGWLDNHQKYLPKGDYFFASWDYEKERILKYEPKIEDQMIYYQQPEIKYNLYLGEFAKKYGEEVGKRPFEAHRLYTASLQHAAHYLICTDSRIDGYDIVIRMRYDTVLGNHTMQLTELCEYVMDTGKAVGIGNSKYADDKNQKMTLHMRDFAHDDPDLLFDFMNIHKRENIDNVLQLIEEEKMFPTCTGWWQILSKPYKGHRNIKGGIQLTRHLDIYKGKLYGR